MTARTQVPELVPSVRSFGMSESGGPLVIIRDLQSGWSRSVFLKNSTIYFDICYFNKIGVGVRLDMSMAVAENIISITYPQPYPHPDSSYKRRLYNINSFTNDALGKKA
jgi:hypothetical protein